MRVADLGFQPVLRERSLDPRRQVPAIGLVVGVLELAPAAFGKMPARGFLMVGARRERAVVEQDVAGDSERYMPPA